VCVEGGGGTIIYVERVSVVTRLHRPEKNSTNVSPDASVNVIFKRT